MPGRGYTVEEVRGAPRATVLSWPEFQGMFLASHRQGEHISIVGPTGSGKTLCGLELCKLIGSRKAKDGRPSRVTVLQYKKRDDTTRMILPEKQWPIVKKWPPAYGQEHVIVWPKTKDAATASQYQRSVFLPLLDIIYEEGGQTVYIPEAAKFERPLPKGYGMAPTMEEFWGTARSLKLTVVSDTQRPCRVTRLMWSEPSWVIVYQLDDEDDLKRVASLSGRKIEVLNTVPHLGEHEFMCIRRQRHAGQREIYVSRVELDQSVTRDKRNNHNGRVK